MRILLNGGDDSLFSDGTAAENILAAVFLELLFRMMRSPPFLQAVLRKNEDDIIVLLYSQL